MASKPWSPLAQQKARFTRAAEAAAKANPDTTITDQFDGFWENLQTVSTSEEAQKRAEAAQKTLDEQGARIRAQMARKEER